jgi:hypothetical protein
MHIQQSATRLSLLGSLVILLAASIVGCGSPVSAPDDTSATSMSKKATRSTTSVWETEPNNDPALASDVIGTSSQSGARMGTISAAGDNDYYLTASIPAGKVLLVNLAMPMNMDYDVQILAGDGVTVLASDHREAGISETLRLTNLTSSSQTYKLRVFSANGSFSTVSPYTLMAGIVN